MNMTPEHREILFETLVRTLELEHAEPAIWHDEKAWLRQAEHGADFSYAAWFSMSPEDAAGRMRYGRALRDLEVAGLVELYRPGTRTVRGIRLTAKGRAIANAMMDTAT